MEESSIFLTDDGSHSIESSFYDATYHSRSGAIEESLTVFISAGLYKLYQDGVKNISIFEMGFGTGLNLLLTYLEAQKLGLEIQYTTIELHPLSDEIVKNLNHGNVLGNPDIFNKMHKLPWDKSVDLSPTFHLCKWQADILNFKHNKEYNLIFYDAFAPNTQADLWTEKVHSPLYDSLSEGGILTTYCSKGEFRRMLETIGYTVNRLPGPGRKRHMIRAEK